MRTRIEILKSGEWRELLLGNEKQIKYNLVANRIGSMSQREISHSNTFTLPYVHQNIQALEINVFSPRSLAKAFNSKCEAKYYVNDRLNQEGFLVINNTDNGTINVNFIDGALEIVEKWGSMSYYDLLNSETIELPTDYKVGIDIMKNYSMTKTAILTPLTVIPERGYNIAKFPNNLNAIGDKFQTNIDKVRLSDTFNPYQSRPIFNVKALFDISIESFGYTPYYDSSIDWQRIADTYIIEKDLSQGQKSGSSTVTTTYPTIASNKAYQYTKNKSSGQFDYHLYIVNFVYPDEVVALYPRDLEPKYSIPNSESGTLLKDYQNLDRCILIPDTSNLSVGTMNWKAKFTQAQKSSFGHSVLAIWTKTSGTGYTFMSLDKTSNTTSETLEVTVNKSELLRVPQGGKDFVGVLFGAANYLANASSEVTVADMIYTEENLPLNTISYDKYDQYEADIINLTHAAPTNTIKELLSSIMEKEGILMSFNNRQKTIKLFGYNSYLTRKEEGNFKDWTKYHQENDIPLYNTDYGSEFGVINEIGLNSPYKGNSYKLILANQLTNSKYSSYKTNYNKKFKDVEALSLVNNTNTPYYEYTNKGLGLVEVSNSGLGTLTQVRAEGINQGAFTGLAQVYNVNYLNLPKAITSWYNLVDTAIRAQATFLLPLNVIKEIDLAEPVYVRKLGGFYIIEEVEEYTGPQTPVKVKLIKLLIEDKDIDGTVLLPHYSSQYSNGYSK